MSERVRALGWLAMIARLLLGGLFIFAGVMKLMNPQIFFQAIEAFKIGLPEHLGVLFTFAVPWTEIIAGTALVLGWWARPNAALLSLMLMVFITLIISALARHMDVKCSCFGKFEIPCTGPVGVCHIVRNGVLLVMALLVVWLGPGALAIDRESTK